MAQQQTDPRTDTLSADVKALREQVDKLSDKLTDSQREVVVLRAELGGQDKRLTDMTSRVGDVNLWLAGFALIITVLLALAGFFGFVQAVRRAKAEAKDWIEQNSAKLQARISVMEAEAGKLLSRMELKAQKVADHAGQIETILNGTIDKAKTYSEQEKADIRKAEYEVKDKPENRYTAEDWNIRAFAAYEDGKLSEAALYWGNVAESVDATSEKIALALFNKGGALGELERWAEEIAVYDDIVRRFGAVSEPALIAVVGDVFGNRGWSRYRLGEDTLFLDDTVRSLERQPEDHLLLCNRAFALYLTGHPRDEVMAAYIQAWQVVGDAEAWEKAALADLRNHGHSVRPDAHPVPQDLIDAVAALAKQVGEPDKGVIPLSEAPGRFDGV